ncbi:MAG TPA: hypothetical protein VLM38_04020 [Blastocatellia bacterium]|nr:hypothetical protein [Blastocatellia bacterium]
MKPFPRNLIAPLLVLVVTAIVYGAIYFREESIPTAVGANLVPAERVLKGEVPYRDFYKIQTPGILLLNAALFKIWGTSLLTAMSGVLVFKILTIAMVFLTGRLAGSWKGALLGVTLSGLWLAPGGPFRPAPIQYEMLFMVSSIYFALRWLQGKNGLHIFASGVAIGMVAIFKQNVGVYAAIALMLSIILISRDISRSEEATLRRAHLLKGLAAAGIGVGLPLGGLVLYLLSRGALGAAIGVFIRAPGEHIQSRFTGYPLPRYALIIFAVGVMAVMLAARLVKRSPGRKGLILSLTLASAAICATLVPQPAIDNSIYWFSPGLFSYAGWIYFRGMDERRVSAHQESATLLVLLLFALAAYGEVFPRSVRGLVIGALPPAFVLLAFLLDRDGRTHASHSEGAGRLEDTSSFTRRLAVAVTATALLVFALRVELPEYFAIDSQRGLSFKADTELKFDRGRGIYLSASRAEEVSATVDTIRSRVEEGGYFFAHALDASSYYFLSARNSPTGATLWNDTGTNERERVRTMAALKEKDVRLVLTSEQAMKAEEYRPLLDLLRNDFHQLPIVIGTTVFLERNR